MNLKAGMRMTLLHKGEEFINDETGESLGFDTKEVATVVLSRILGKVSYAKLESGSLEDVENGDFLNMIEAAVAADPKGAASKL